MMGRRAFGRTFGGLLLAGFAVSGCGLFNSKASFRYRMTVEGAHSGSAVYEILAEKNNDIVKLPEERSGGSIIRGEALVVETPSGPVFVLLDKADKSGQPLRVGIVDALLPNRTSGNVDAYMDTVRTLSSSDAKGDLPRAAWPMMVRFRDINDPKSVEKVDPASIGVTRILLETTGDAVTTGIQKRLAWLDALESSLTNSIVQTSASSLVDQLRKK